MSIRNEQDGIHLKDMWQGCQGGHTGHPWPHLYHVSHVYMSKYLHNTILNNFPREVTIPGYSFCLGSYLYWEDSFFRDVLFLKKLHFPRSHIPGKLHFPASLISPLSNFSGCNFSQDVNFLWKSCFFGKYNSLGSHISQEVTFSGKSLVSQSLGNIIW